VTDDVVYLSAMEEQKHYRRPGQRAELDARRHASTDDLVVVRQARRRHRRAGRAASTCMDVSPKQLVSVAAALIPFLENDDANRALMGSNMQRQAVPLVACRCAVRRHRHGSGRRARLGRRDRGAPRRASSIRSTRPVSSIRATDEIDAVQAGRRHLPPDEVPALEPDRPASTSVRWCRWATCVDEGDIIADGPSTDLGELALGRNVLVAFMPWNGYNFEDSILLSRAHREGRRLHLDPHRGIRGRWPATPSSARRKSPATSRTSAKRR